MLSEWDFGAVTTVAFDAGALGGDDGLLESPGSSRKLATGRVQEAESLNAG